MLTALSNVFPNIVMRVTNVIITLMGRFVKWRKKPVLRAFATQSTSSRRILTQENALSNPMALRVVLLRKAYRKAGPLVVWKSVLLGCVQRETRNGGCPAMSMRTTTTSVLKVIVR
jgi:hypothetical protein